MSFDLRTLLLRVLVIVGVLSVFVVGEMALDAMTGEPPTHPGIEISQAAR